MLETERLYLKPYSIEIANDYNRWSNDREISYFDDDSPEDSDDVSLEETIQYIEKIINKESTEIIHFIIYEKVKMNPIGYCMIAYIDKYNRNCKFGITIGEKKEWGKGFCTEVLIEIIKYCFNDLNLNRIGAEIYSFNKRSQHIFEKCGFKREGILRELVYKKGKFEDSYEYGIIKSDWVSMVTNSSK